MPKFLNTIIKKTDGTYNVKILFYHGTMAYLDTKRFLISSQLTKALKIKDQFIAVQLEAKIAKYLKDISALRGKLKSLSAESLKQHLIGKDLKIDFLVIYNCEAFIPKCSLNTLEKCEKFSKPNSI